MRHTRGCCAGQRDGRCKGPVAEMTVKAGRESVSEERGCCVLLSETGNTERF